MTPLDALLRDLRALRDEWRAQIRSAPKESAWTSYWSGRADALGDLNTFLARCEHPPAARAPVCTCQGRLAHGSYGDEYCPVHSEPPASYYGDREQTTVEVYADGKLVSSVPPTEERWRCTRCGQIFNDSAVLDPGRWHFNEDALWCGPLEKESKP